MKVLVARAEDLRRILNGQISELGERVLGPLPFETTEPALGHSAADRDAEGGIVAHREARETGRAARVGMIHSQRSEGHRRRDHASPLLLVGISR